MTGKNITYPVLIGIIILSLAFFFTTRLWMPDDRKDRTVNYDTVFTVSDVWDIKISDARFENGVLKVKYFAKPRLDAVNPPTLKITLENGNENLQADIIQMEDNPFGKEITVHGLPEKWYYVRFTVRCKALIPEHTDAPLDQFGNEIERPVKEGKDETRWVQIDYRRA